MSTGGEYDDQAEYDALDRELSQPDPELAALAGGEAATPEPTQQPAAEAYAPQRGEQQQQPAHYGPPAVDDDPIGHFSARQNAVEAQLAQKNFMEHVERSEQAIRHELDEGDYDTAIAQLTASRMREIADQFPDTHQTQVEAYRRGFQNPAQLRQAIFQHDVITVAQHAMRNGMTPAQAYYRLAVERGYKPQTAMTRSVRNFINNDGLTNLNDKQFDAFWKDYERAMKSVEER
jgi:hypothetical protein